MTRRVLKIILLAGIFSIFIPTPGLSFAEEILNEEHSHYRDQIHRIHEALEKGKEENAINSLLSDARRSARWIFEEPAAAETVERRLGRRIDREFFDLNLPVLIHPLPARPFLLQKTTPHSSLVTDFEEGTITARVTVPFFENNGMRKARNEAVFLSILLLRDGIMNLPVREFVRLRKTVPSEAYQSGGTIAKYLISKGLARKGLSVEIHPLAAGGGIALASIVLPVPLHIGDTLALTLERSAASPPLLDKTFSNAGGLPPTGLLIDARRFRIHPFRDLVLLSDSRRILMIPDEGRPSGVRPFGWAGWSDGQDVSAIEQRVGLHPLVVRPEEFLHRQVFVFSQRDARRILQSLYSSKLLSTGHILVLLAPQRLVSPPALSQPTKGHAP